MCFCVRYSVWFTVQYSVHCGVHFSVQCIVYYSVSYNIRYKGHPPTADLRYWKEDSISPSTLVFDAMERDSVLKIFSQRMTE